MKGKRVQDSLDQAFNELLTSGKVIPLTPEERSLVASFKARKAGGKLKTLSATAVLADMDAALRDEASGATHRTRLRRR